VNLNDVTLLGPRLSDVGADAATQAAYQDLVACVTLQVSIVPASFPENAGSNAAAGTVTRNLDYGSGELVVMLSSSDTTEARVPIMVQIPAGAASAVFAVRAVDDMLVDGTQRVTIAASAVDYFDGSTTADVLDNDVANPGGIRGRVFEDRNSNGRFDLGEAVLQGWQAYIDLDRSGGFNVGEPTVRTNLTGQYTFANVAPGMYSVSVVPRAGFASASRDAIVVTGQVTTGVDLAVRRAGRLAVSSASASTKRGRGNRGYVLDDLIRLFDDRIDGRGATAQIVDALLV